ncbi:MAG: Uma2 family endonuclease [Candidatus Poribacteria bacterium]|nr:Uma2 family endonuclease [Candidatus Poribacteria bacterium]
MATKTEKEKLSYVPTDALYPEEDGEPMAASDLHRAQLFRTLSTLETHFSQDPTVYVSGDILMYYVQGVPNKSIAPDVLVSFGIGMKKRRTYLVWEEGKVPEFVMEFSSKNTYHDDLTKKMDIYASLEIQDYFLYDAEGLYLPSQLIGFELVDGNYVPIPPDENGGIRSSSLGLGFRMKDQGIGIYNPVAGGWLKTRAEAEAIRADVAEARAEQEANARQKETTRANTAEARAEQEATRADTAEAEVAQLREQLARLQARS